MTALGTLFPLDMSQLTRSIRYKTDVTRGRNGQEVRNALWQDPLYVYNAAFAVKSYPDIETLEAFFHGMNGREQSFLIKDFQDFAVENWTEFAETPDDMITEFQLIKNYTEAVAGTYTRTITKPKAIEGSGGVTIRDDEVEVDTGDYSFSSSTGIVTFDTAPATGHTIDFTIDEFYVPVRFDTDDLPVDLLNYWVDSGGAKGGNVNIPDIPLIEVRGE